MKKTQIIIILIIASLLRFWRIYEVPPHLTQDEASLGYNAYSILKTGRDEHGEIFPIIFKSFGDFNPGLYVYLTVPSIAIFGLNEFSVRLPSVLAGILGVFLIYLVVDELLKNKKIAILSSFFLAISPWHLQFSRGAWQAGVNLTLVLAGIYFFLSSIKGKPRLLILSALSFALTLWTYQGAKFSTSIVLVGLIIFFQKELFKLNKKIVLISILIGLIVSLPILASFDEGKTGRLAVLSVFSYRRSSDDLESQLLQGNEKVGDLSYYLYHSESLNFLRGILVRWLNHFSGKFIFFDGDWSNPRQGVPNAGVILLMDGIFLILGLISLSRMGAKREALFIWYFLVLAPLPSALSRDSVHAVRSLNMVIPLTIIIAFGMDFLIEKGKLLGKISYLVIGILFVIYFADYVYYLDQYFVHASIKNSKEWQYGYREMVYKIIPIQNKYKEIVVKQDYSQPYIFFLFYGAALGTQQYQPEEFQKIAKDVFIPSKYGDVGLFSNLGKITFRQINWSIDKDMSGKLFVIDPITVSLADLSHSDKTRIIDQIKYLDGTIAFNLIETR